MSLELKYLTDIDAHLVFEMVMRNFDISKTAWVNPPEFTDGKFTHTTGWSETEETHEVSPEEALAIYKKKLDGAYTERFLLFMSQLEVIAKNGYKVAIVQFQGHDGAPFDSSGWLVVVVEGLPIYHIAPWDLNLKDIEEFVTLVPAYEMQNELVCWKGTDKYGEALALNAAVSRDGNSIVAIAKGYSNLC